MDPAHGHDATRRSYDAVAEQYAAKLRDELDGKPLDRALLSCVAEMSGGGAPVADVGCGPGHVAAWLASRGTAAVGIDLSGGMIATGRRIFPDVEFRQGDFLSLPAADGEFAGAAVLYSIIHLAPGELPDAFAELHRVLRPGGPLLVAFHVGTEVRHVAEFFGQQVDLDFRFCDPAAISDVMTAAGLAVEATLERSAYPHEVQTRRAYLLARRDA